MSIYTKENGYNFRVVYNVKHTKKTSALYGFLSEESVSFPTLKDAFHFAKVMHGKRTNKIEVVGLPTIERIAS